MNIHVREPHSTEIYPLSLHDALPISIAPAFDRCECASISGPAYSAPATATVTDPATRPASASAMRSEEHTSELQSHHDIVCRLLLEKKKTKKIRMDKNF